MKIFVPSSSILFLLLFVLVSSSFIFSSLVVLAKNPTGTYSISGTPSTSLPSGWQANLKFTANADYDKFHNNASYTYENLIANVYSLANNRDCRLRIVPDKTSLKPGQEMPYVVPATAAYFTDPINSTYVSSTNTNGLPPYNANNVQWSVETASASPNGVENKQLLQIVTKNPSIVNTPDRAVLTINGLRYEAQWVEFSFNLTATQNLFGFAYHNSPFCLTCNRQNEAFNLSLWNSDAPGVPYNLPIYSTHPVLYLFDDKTNAWYTLHFVNSHAQRMMVSAMDSSSQQRTVTMTFLGGIIDVFIIQRDSPIDAVAAWTLLLQPSFDADAMNLHSPYKNVLFASGSNSPHAGLQEPTAVIPYWALGTHLCRWGYKTIGEVWDAVVGMKNNSLPYDSSFSDIDWMKGFRVFANDPVGYPLDQLKVFTNNLTKLGDMKYVQILDPGVATDTSYGTFQRLLQNPKQFISEPFNPSQPSIGYVWPGFTAFVAYDGPEGHDFWVDEMNRYLDEIDVAGSWIDMNEMSSFAQQGHCPGQMRNGSSNWVFPNGTTWANLNWTALPIWLEKYCTTALNSSLNHIPYDNDGFLGNGFNLYTRTLDAASRTATGYIYNNKNMFGYYEARATYHSYLKKNPGVRPFILTRSSYSGSGRYTSEWTGDTTAVFTGNGGLYDSIQAILSSNTFGIPVNGADIGGFSDPTSAELMTRWSTVGAWYSFTRWHHGNRDPPQEPYRYDDNVINSIRNAMIQRYKFTPYLFSLIVRTSRYGEPTLVHPSFNFPNEMTSLLTNDPQIEGGNTKPRPFFMWGDAILICPVVEQGVATIPIRFPNATWYESTSLRFAVKGPTDVNSYSVTPMYEKPLPSFIRAGRVLPIHTGVDQYMNAPLNNLNKNDAAQVWNFYHNESYILERSTDRTLVKLRQATPIGIVAVHDDVNIAATSSSSASGFSYFDDFKDGLIVNDNTFAMISYSSTISANAASGQVTATLSGKPPSTLYSAQQPQRTFTLNNLNKDIIVDSSSSSSTIRYKGGYIDVVFSSSDMSGNSSNLPLPQYCDVNGSTSLPLMSLNGISYTASCNLTSHEVNVDASAGRVSYKWRFTIFTTAAKNNNQIPLIDFSQPLVLRWSTTPISPSPNNNNNGSPSHKSKIVVGVAAGVGGLIVVLIIVVAYIKNKKNPEARHLQYSNLEDNQRKF